MNHDENAWMRKAQEIAKLGNWDQDPATGELWWSDQTYSLFLLEPQKDKITFEKFLKMVHPEDRKKILVVTDEALASEDNPYRIEYRMKLPDGVEKYVYEEAIIERNDEGVPVKMIGIIQDITERKRNEIELEELVLTLRNALDEVKTLRGIIPICASCKKIRDEKGYWNQVEAYIQRHTEASFSHGICENCVSKLYPELQEDPS